MTPPQDRAAMNVTVTFPMSTRPAYHDDDATSTDTVGSVRDRAMEHFGVQPDPNYVYYLSHERQRVDDAASIASVAGPARAVQFRLIKELTQG